MQWLILGIGLLAGVILLLNWIGKASPKTVLKFLKWVFLGLGLLAFLFIVLTGRFALIWTLLFVGLPWLGRLRTLRNLFRAARGPAAGQGSTVTTRFFAMRLDHDSGAMDGTIREGAFAGRNLSDLNESERLALVAEVAATDAQSMQILAAYLDRMHGPDWRQAAGAAGADTNAGGEHSADSDSGPMTRKQALEILGLKPGADREAIKAAHRRLMKVAHPDKGGSDYIATRVNEARRILLNE